MKKKKLRALVESPLRRILLLMRLTTLFLTIGILQVHAALFSQNTKFNLDLKNQTVRMVLAEIEKTSDYRFFYSEDLVNLDTPTSVSVADKDITQVLDALFTNMPITYEVMENNLIALKPVFNQQELPVSGNVTDSKGLPLPGVTVVVKGTIIGTITDVNGKFTLKVPADAKTLVISFIGKKTLEIDLGGKTTFEIRMEEFIELLDDIVVTGFQTITCSS